MIQFWGSIQFLRAQITLALGGPWRPLAALEAVEALDAHTVAAASRPPLRAHPVGGRLRSPQQ